MMRILADAPGLLEAEFILSYCVCCRRGLGWYVYRPWRDAVSKHSCGPLEEFNRSSLG